MDWLLGFFVLAGLAVAVSWYIAGLRERPLTAEERAAQAPGNTVSLSDGTLYYTERGPQDGKPVIMVHGFGVPQFVFEQNATGLEQADFRVILFDHFGRGWSDRPRARYDPDFFDRELSEFLNALKISGPVGMVGYSMGGMIAAEFAARHPDRVAALILLSPAGIAISPFLGQFFGKIIRLPLIGDWLWRIGARSLLLGDPQFQQAPADTSRCMQGDDTIQMRYSGYFNALLQSWRHLPMENRDEVFATASRGVPVLALFGGKDPTIDIQSAARLKKVAPHAQVEIIEDGTHGMLYEMYDTINPMMDAFLEENMR